ncbi:MAG: MBL fold metallo-hydrolase [Bacillota bacterium]
MRIKKIGTRGVHFVFEDGESSLPGELGVYLICSDDRVYLCDTHLGPKYMEPVKQYLPEHDLAEKQVILFNSHADWDHIWGNSAFQNALIIGHTTCRTRIRERGLYDLERYRGIYNDGTIEIKLPNLVFDLTMEFTDDKVAFIYAPGHTACSAICYDKEDLVLFVGDLVEYPVPVLSHYDLEGYIKTLEYIKNLPAATIISSHSGIVDTALIDANIKYIKNILNPSDPEDEDYQLFTKHSLVLKYEEMFREKLGHAFDYRCYKRDFWHWFGNGYHDLSNERRYLKEISFSDLEAALKAYLQNCD